MNDHQIINTILVIVGLAIFGIRIIRGLGKAASRLVAGEKTGVPQNSAAGRPAPQARAAPAAAQVPAVRRRVTQAARQPFAPAEPAGAPVPSVPAATRSQMPARAQSFAALAADAFPTLDLTLPDAEAPPGAGTPARPRRRTLPDGIVPGTRAWGPGAIVAMEILGPPVSLRSGATLGAPHAF